MPRRYWPKTLDAYDSYRGGHTQIRPKDGYVEEYCPTHPACHRGTGVVLQHRLVMERTLRRYLTGKEVVHHIDHNRQNNEPGNLQLFPSHREHMLYEKRLTAPRYNLAVIEEVRRAAADPNVSLKQLSVSNTTASRICQDHGIKWVDPNVRYLTEDQVRTALQGRTTLEAAALLGCSHGTLRRKFDHMLTKRTTPRKRDPVSGDLLGEPVPPKKRHRDRRRKPQHTASSSHETLPLQA